MTEIKNQTGTKKKLLIPVVVLMLLGVSLAGAAYAYSSTVTVQQNALDAQYLSIDLTGGEIKEVNPNANYIKESGVVTFEDHFVYAPAKTNEVKATVAEKLVLTVKLTVSGDVACDTLKVSSSNIDTYLAQTVGNKTISQLFSVTVSKNSDGTGAQALTTTPTAVPGALSKAANVGSVEVILYFFVDAVSTDPISVTAADNTSLNAAGLASTFEGYNFGLTFEATKA